MRLVSGQGRTGRHIVMMFESKRSVAKREKGINDGQFCSERDERHGIIGARCWAK